MNRRSRRRFILLATRPTPSEQRRALQRPGPWLHRSWAEPAGISNDRVYFHRRFVRRDAAGVVTSPGTYHSGGACGDLACAEPCFDVTPVRASRASASGSASTGPSAMPRAFTPHPIAPPRPVLQRPVLSTPQASAQCGPNVCDCYYPQGYCPFPSGYCPLPQGNCVAPTPSGQWIGASPQGY